MVNNKILMYMKLKDINKTQLSALTGIPATTLNRIINGTVINVKTAYMETIAKALGTTIYNADRIAEVLRLPEGVLPVTTVTLGWPEEMPPLTDRLPLEGVVHRERYEDYTPETIDRIWAEREASPETAELLRANGLPNLARIFTERRYTAEDNRLFSRKYFDMLKKQGFFNQ